MQVEWDPQKANTNLLKHGVTLGEAATIFFDDLSQTGYDPDHSMDEDRFATFRVSSLGRLLVVTHTNRNERIRMISARRAKRSERKIYEQG